MLRTVTDSSLPDVLAIVGDPSTAERYAEWLTPAYDVDVATPPFEGDPPTDASVVVLDWSFDPTVRRAVLDAGGGRPAPAVVAICEGIPESDPIEAGVHDYLLAPVDDGVLRAAVERAYNQWAYRKWLGTYLDATADYDAETGIPSEIPPEVAEARDGMDLTLEELVAELDYSTLFRALLSDREDDET